MDEMSRTDFLNLAGVVEGGLVFLALGFGWVVGISPWDFMDWDLDAVGIGLLATLPMYLAFQLFKEPRDIAVEVLGGVLSRCRWDDMVLVAALAGFGEELFFRGVLQPWIAAWSPITAFFLVNLLFGLVHFASVTYFFIATIVGMYLSWLTYGIGEPNLWRAIVAHGAYDAIAFYLIVREHQQKARADQSKSDS